MKMKLVVVDEVLLMEAFVSANMYDIWVSTSILLPIVNAMGTRRRFNYCHYGSLWDILRVPVMCWSCIAVVVVAHFHDDGGWRHH